MQINENQISAIVDAVVGKMTAGADVKKTVPTVVPNIKKEEVKVKPLSPEEAIGTFADIETAIQAARKAFLEYKSISLAQRNKIIQAVREICMSHVAELSKMGVEETTFGRYEDKLKKNTAAIEKTPGVEDVEAAVWTGDNGATILEKAPYGVIGAITPCTNPSETLICNGIGFIAGGNSAVFNAHPAAKKTSIRTIHLINKAIISAGGPANMLTTVANPTIASAQDLMKHSGINLLVVTGGPAVVASAMKSGKRCVGAGPGNPPVIVDDTADIERAGRDIVAGASMDNNIICVIEKEVIAYKKITDDLKKAMVAAGAYEINKYQSQRLEKIVVNPDNTPNKNWIGKDAHLILKQIGIDADPSTRLIITETGPDHPFAKLEMLMPIIPIIRVDHDIDAAIELAYKLEGGCFHTAGIHSKNIEHMHKMAVRMNTSIFVKNAPFYAGLGLGGEGPISFTIASPTGEGVTTARHFTRYRRCVIAGYFRIV